MKAKISVGWSYSAGRSDDGPMTDVLEFAAESSGEDGDLVLLRVTREGVADVKMFLSWKMTQADCADLIDQLEQAQRKANDASVSQPDNVIAMTGEPEKP